MRSLFLATLSAALFTLPAAAQAQVSAYALFTYADFTGIPAGTLPNIFSPNGILYNASSGSDPGAGFGVLLEIPHTSRFSAGLDLRGSINPGTIGGGSFSAAAEVAFQPRITRLRTYFELGGGTVSAHSPTYVEGSIFVIESLTGPSLSSSNGTFNVDFGFDIPLPRSITWRVADLNIAIGHNAPGSSSSLFSTATGYGGVSAVTVGTGVLYRFGHGRADR